jgi:HemY protein
MIRLLTILFCAALVAGGIVWIADRQGDLIFTVDGYELRTSASIAIGFAILFAALSAFVARVAALLLGGPGAFGRWTASRRATRGNEALSRGLVAAAAGDSAEARRHARKAGSLLGAPPLALLLTAQAAQLDGDERGQFDAYRAMLEHPETEFLGLRGLFMQATRCEDSEQAMEFAARAHALKPRAAWAANALFDLKSARRQWSDAKVVLESAARAKLLDPGVARRRRAVLLTAEALDHEGRGEGERALAAALEALNLSPRLAPAAALAAHKLAQAGRAWRAQDIVEAAWAQTPHPDLASAYAAIRPDEDVETRARRLNGLAQLNRDHFESRMVEAEQAINLARWAEARRVLAPLAQAFATTRVCALMAEIEQGERHDAAAAHSWLSRAVRAPRDADWRCGNCGWNTPDWHAVCGNCGAFDTLAWSAPAADTLEMMPGGAHDERLGMDSTPPSFLQAPGEIGENADTVRPPSRTPWRKDGNEMGDAGLGFVVLSRPPDDPGPGGHDFDPEPVAARGENP